MKNFWQKNKRLLSVVVVYVLCCFTLLMVLTNPPDSLIELAFENIVKNRQKLNVIEKDALYVITTGTGAPMPDAKRSGAQTVVVAGGKTLVFDAGPGSTLKLELSPVDVANIDALFITHFHSDHIGGIGELFLKRWANSSAEKPLPVLGPTGVEEIINGFEMAYQSDKKHRIDHHGEEIMTPNGFGGQVESFDLGSDFNASKIVYQQGEVEVIAFNVNHTPVNPAVGYRVNYKDRSIVITGDTKYDPSLIRHAQGTDVLISETLNKKFSNYLAKAGQGTNTNITPIALDIQDYHISPEEATKVALEAGVEQLVFTHILPPVPTDLLVRPYLKEAKEVYDGNIYLANDGTLISLPVNSDEVIIKETLR